MDLQELIEDVLGAGDRAMTFEDVMSGVAKGLEADVMATLNRLHGDKRINRHFSGQHQPFRYQALERQV